MQCNLLTADEIAEQLRLKPDTISLWARQGRIPALRLTRKVIRFELSEVISALESGSISDAAGDSGESQGVHHAPSA